jgi:hypothetical protein
VPIAFDFYGYLLDWPIVGRDQNATKGRKIDKTPA